MLCYFMETSLRYIRCKNLPNFCTFMLSFPLGFRSNTELESEPLVFLKSDHRCPVREAVDVSGLVQLLVSVCQRELVAQTNFTPLRIGQQDDL